MIKQQSSKFSRTYEDGGFFHFEEEDFDFKEIPDVDPFNLFEAMTRAMRRDLAELEGRRRAAREGSGVARRGTVVAMGVDGGRISCRRGAAAVAPPLHPYFSDLPPTTSFSGIPQVLDHQQALLASSTSSFTHKPPPPPPPPHPVSVSNPNSFPPLPRAPKPSTPSTTPLPIPSSSNLHPRRVPSSGHQPSAPPLHQRSYGQATSLVGAKMCGGAQGSEVEGRRRAAREGGASGSEGRRRRWPATAAGSGADLRSLGAGLKCLAE